MHPTAIERIDAGHKTINYGLGDAMGEIIVYVAAFSQHVNLGFFDGVDLPDPDDVLQGTRKLLRHIKLKDAATLDAPNVSALINAAFANRMP